MHVVVVDYGMGNLRSVEKAFVRIGCTAEISASRETISRADRLVLPGVGHFNRGMAMLRRADLQAVLESRVIGERVPVLGICLGLQLMTAHSEEGDCDGLGWLDAKTTRFHLDEHTPLLRVPHIGWNTLLERAPDSFLTDCEEDESFYFTHSYHLSGCDPTIVAAKTLYGEEFVAAVQSGHIFGTQFHPEKSHERGLQVLRRFIEAS